MVVMILKLEDMLSATAHGTESERCPLCNTSPQASIQSFELRGFDDVTRLLGAGPAEPKDTHSGGVNAPGDSNSEEEFEAMPTFRVGIN